jgi:hypothetical protein
MLIKPDKGDGIADETGQRKRNQNSSICHFQKNKSGKQPPSGFPLPKECTDHMHDLDGNPPEEQFL